MKTQNDMLNRRKFLKTSALSAVLAINIPQIVEAAMPETQKPNIIKQDDIILFQGDSITDAGRKREDANFNTNNNLGTGYVLHTAAELLTSNASKNLKIYNKGISGNKVYQLVERWETDCMALKPNILSVLIGVNDYWHFHSGKYKGTVEIYENDFRALLQKTMAQFPDLKLVIGEPFALKDIKAVDDTWYPAFDEYRMTARKIAKDFNAVFVPYQAVFNEALKYAPGVYWTNDGVHPSLAGAKLMANAWLKATKTI
ncbi:SGNH/GDSL hydrolase family protein [Pedobacter alpinus]|uniref:SGNH/GDSL hydrolase family protein n=1 Tax=Pedobacter alpinus TaxID=1590643 RepID=A0ABW5TYI1_9SPHI